MKKLTVLLLMCSPAYALDQAGAYKMCQDELTGRGVPILSWQEWDDHLISDHDDGSNWDVHLAADLGTRTRPQRHSFKCAIRSGVITDVTWTP